MTSITLESITNGKGVLHASKDLSKAVRATLAQLKVLLVTIMNLLNPLVMVRGSRVVDVVLELDDVCIGDMVGIDGAQNRSRIAMDCFCAEGGSGETGQGESCDTAHDDGCCD